MSNISWSRGVKLWNEQEDFKDTYRIPRRDTEPYRAVKRIIEKILSRKEATKKTVVKKEATKKTVVKKEATKKKISKSKDNKYSDLQQAMIYYNLKEFYPKLSSGDFGYDNRFIELIETDGNGNKREFKNLPKIDYDLVNRIKSKPYGYFLPIQWYNRQLDEMINREYDSEYKAVTDFSSTNYYTDYNKLSGANKKKADYYMNIYENFSDSEKEKLLKKIKKQITDEKHKLIDPEIKKANQLILKKANSFFDKHNIN